MNEIIVADVAIRRDQDGRYCVNDLHRASGGEKRHGPSYWLAIVQTKELIAELETTGKPVVILEGRRGGTFVCKELVYAYAMWISAAFNLKVIRTFDAIATGASSAPTAEPLPSPVAKLSVDLCFAQAFFGTFKVAESSKVAIFRQIGESYGANTSYLPRLVVDEAPGLPGSSAPTAPLTDLLKARGARVSAREFNLLVALAGYLEQHTRKTTSKRFADRGGVKPFWSITPRGLEFGKNMVAPESPRETVPHWYIHKFDELRERIRPFYRRNLEQAA